MTEKLLTGMLNLKSSKTNKKEKLIQTEFVYLFDLENLSVNRIPPHTPLLYSKTGVYRGLPIFRSPEPLGLQGEVIG